MHPAFPTLSSIIWMCFLKSSFLSRMICGKEEKWRGFSKLNSHDTTEQLITRVLQICHAPTLGLLLLLPVWPRGWLQFWTGRSNLFWTFDQWGQKQASKYYSYYTRLSRLASTFLLSCFTLVLADSPLSSIKNFSTANCWKKGSVE